MITCVFQYLECEVGYIGPRCKTPCPAPHMDLHVSSCVIVMKVNVII